MPVDKLEPRMVAQLHNHINWFCVRFQDVCMNAGISVPWREWEPELLKLQKSGESASEDQVEIQIATWAFNLLTLA